MDKKKKEELRQILEKGCKVLTDDELIKVAGGSPDDERYRVCMSKYRECMGSKNRENCYEDFLSCIGDGQPTLGRV